jgi:hypothetical protein
VTSPCIFICYRVAATTENAIPWLKEMIADLHALGAEILIDDNDSAYPDLSSLRRALLPCSAMIVVQTPETLTSNHVQLAVNAARELLMQEQQGNVIRLISSLSSMYDAPWEWMRLRAFDLSSGYRAVRDNLLLALGFNADSWKDTQPSLGSVGISTPTSSNPGVSALTSARATPHLPIVSEMETYALPAATASVPDMKTYVPLDPATPLSNEQSYIPHNSATPMSNGQTYAPSNSAALMSHEQPYTPFGSDASVPDMQTFVPSNAAMPGLEAEDYLPSAPVAAMSQMEPSALPYASAPTLADGKMYVGPSAPFIPAVVQQTKHQPSASYILLVALAVVIILFSVITAFFFHQVQATANISVTATANTNNNIVHMDMQGTATANAQGSATAAAQANALATANAQATAAALAHAQATAAVVATMQAYQPTSYEAEAANNTLAGGARRVRCGHCSGGERVAFVGFSGTLQFNNITVPLSGYYKLIIYYSDNMPRTALMSVNGANGVTVNFGSTGSFNTPGPLTTTVFLSAGQNTILFNNPNNWAPDFDRIIV